MEQLKVSKGDIFHLKQQAEWIVYRSKKVEDLVLKRTVMSGADYEVVLPEIELNEDNAVEYLEYYKRVIRKAREYKVKTIAIEAVDMQDEELTVAFASELKEILEAAMLVSSIAVTIVCKDRSLVDLYEIALYGEIKSSQITLVDKLEYNDVILIPTQRNLLKFDKNYKVLKKNEPRSVFYKCYSNRFLDPGKYYLVEGHTNANCYFFMNMIKDRKYKRMKQEDFNALVLKGIENVLEIASDMQCKDITIPVIRYMKKQEDNEKFVRDLIDVVCEYAEEQGINIRFYCSDEELWNLVLKDFEEGEEEDGSEKEEK